MNKPITAEILKQVAELAKLDVPAERMDDLIREFQKMISYVDEINFSDVSETKNQLEPSLPLRADTPAQGLDRAGTFANAPETDGQSFIVPLVLGE